MPPELTDFVVEFSGLSGRDDTLDCIDIFLREIGNPKHLPISTL
jgi:hypothetical protein